eukprot:XP_001708221.1 Hypothetical protein GL50803_31902 [Giardia lamblia ATCC 50803]
MKPWTRASLQDAHYIYMDSLQAFKCISTCTCTRSSPTGSTLRRPFSRWHTPTIRPFARSQTTTHCRRTSASRPSIFQT